MQATPATWRMLIDRWLARATLRTCAPCVAVRRLPRALAEALLPLGALSVWNLYGPTETTIWSTVWIRVVPARGPVS